MPDPKVRLPERSGGLFYFSLSSRYSSLRMRDKFGGGSRLHQNQRFQDRIVIEME